MSSANASSKASLAKDPSVACKLCGTTVSRKDDLARHMKLHSDEREKLKICCLWQGCNYKSLQKSNVQTHMRTHTGEKLQCPSCTFATTDGGSLIRHRKRIHGYQPRPRRQAATGKVSTLKKSYRPSPYSREYTSPSNAVSYSEPSIIDSLGSCSPASSSPSCLELLYLSDSVSGPGSPQDIDFTFPWDKTFVGENSVSCYQESSFIQPNSPLLEPVSQFPAAGASPVLLGTDLSQFWPSPYPFGTQPTQSFEIGSSPKYPDIHPAYEFTAAPALFSTYKNPTPGTEIYNLGCGLRRHAPSLSDYIGTIPTTPSPTPETFVNWNALDAPRSDVLSLSPSPSALSPISSPSSIFSDSVWDASSPTPSLTSEEFEQFLAACST